MLQKMLWTFALSGKESDSEKMRNKAYKTHGGGKMSDCLESLFNMDFCIDKPIRLIELFGGIGSQAMALRLWRYSGN